MKYLRAAAASGNHSTTVRFFACGEYGSKLSRPHYHIVLFGYDFPDKTPWQNHRGNQLFRSPELERLWPKGFSTIGEVNWQSAAYTARYIMKKISGDDADDHYDGKVPEFTRCSLRPGIGHGWIERYWRDVYPLDQVVIIRDGQAKQYKPPRYYDKWLQEHQPDIFEEVWRKRVMNAKAKERELTELRSEENAKQYAVDRRLKREYENDS